MRFVSRVQVDREVRVPFSVAHDYAEDFFRAAERDVHVRIPLRDLFWALRGRFDRPVKLVFALHPDEHEAGRVHDALMVEWRAGTHLLPHFHGTLRLRIASVESTALRLEGAYRPPLGFAGRIFDRILGRRIARSTMAELLGRLVEAMERREREYRAADVQPESSGITA